MKKLWTKWSEDGMRLPFLHDPVSKKPSVTLLFPYVTFAMAVISVVLLHIWPSLIVATSATIGLWFISTVFYLLRKLSKAKFSLEEKSFELDSGDSTGEPSSSPDDLTSL